MGRDIPRASGNVILRNFIFRVRSSSGVVVGRSLVTECPLSEFWLPNDGARELDVMVATLVAAVATDPAVGWRLKLKKLVAKGVSKISDTCGKKMGAYLLIRYGLC
jgi:hypothetical protein